ncbi:uncharacterized protein [Palaemon carinicauda]|uniref:uncharacterized protein n=1 Tax=Palaemon carinicauda TaxID=392227 RepID=UPI0035B57235
MKKCDYNMQKKWIVDEERIHRTSRSLNSPSKGWYLPHHPVFITNKSDKTRVVADCTASFKGVSLNSQVMQGLDMMKDLPGIVIRLREGKVAIAADIEAMYHQVFVNPTGRDVFQFLWWPQGGLDKNPKHYCMTVHIFGDVWSPACTIFELKGTLHRNCNDAAKEAVSNFYIDDLLHSS